MNRPIARNAAIPINLAVATPGLVSTSIQTKVVNNVTIVFIGSNNGKLVKVVILFLILHIYMVINIT